MPYNKLTLQFPSSHLSNISSLNNNYSDKICIISLVLYCLISVYNNAPLLHIDMCIVFVIVTVQIGGYCV